MTPELSARIEQEAEKYMHSAASLIDDIGPIHLQFAYCEGAKAYAHYKERWEQAKKVLEDIKAIPYPYMDPTDFGSMCDYIEKVRELAEKALSSWKEEGKGGEV